MAKEVVKNLSLYLGSLKLPSLVNQVEFNADADSVDMTNGASAGWSEAQQGLKKTSLGAELFLEDTAEPELTLDTILAAATAVPFSATKTYPVAAGDVAYFQKVLTLNFARKMKVGDAWGGSLKFASLGSPAVRGRALENVIRVATGNSAAYDLGVAVGATERLWVATHVIAWIGTSLDLKIQSDTTGFPSATDRITVPQFTALGSDVSYVDGPITDTFYRVNATLVGTSVEYLVLFGIAPKS